MDETENKQSCNTLLCQKSKNKIFFLRSGLSELLTESDRLSRTAVPVITDGGRSGIAFKCLIPIPIGSGKRGGVTSED